MQKLFYNCDIITLEDTKGECLLTEDGVISFVGDLDEGMRRAAPTAKRSTFAEPAFCPRLSTRIRTSRRSRRRSRFARCTARVLLRRSKKNTAF